MLILTSVCLPMEEVNGSKFSGVPSYRTLASHPPSRKSYPGSPSSSHDCHQPRFAMMTSGAMPSKYSAVSLIQPWGDSIFIHSPSPIPYFFAVAGLIFAHGSFCSSRV